MTCTLRFRDDGRDVLTSAWTARSIKGNDKETDVRYNWGAPTLSFFSSATALEDVVLRLPFNSFAAYVDDCKKRGETADLRDENIPKVIRDYPSPVPTR